MPIVVNTNAAATTAAFNLSKNHANLSKSLARLSSGQRITSPADDAGGLAVAYKLDSTVKRTEAVLNNHQNALSFLQVQDGALESVGNIVSRMSELRTMAADITKNDGDIENYSKEFRELQHQLSQIKESKFNGVELFAAEGDTHSKGGTGGPGNYVYSDTSSVDYEKFKIDLLTHPSGNSSDGQIDLNVVNLEHLLSIEDASSFSDGVTTGQASGLNVDLDVSKTVNIMGKNPWYATGLNTQIKDELVDNIESISVEEFTNIIQKIADARAENGAEQQRVQSSYELQSTNLVNLEAAHGRIMDIDVALESTRFAKHNVLVQASASMTAQANQLTQVALTLLQ
ncbi:flagellin [Opitutales bacterium]|nr:flagellin [Opitutales bacterium]